MAALATKEQVEARLGRALTPAEEARIQALLDDASAIVRNYTRTDFEREETTEVLRIINGRLKPKQKPIVAVTAVAIVDPWQHADPQPVPFMFDRIDSIQVTGSEVLVNAPEWWADRDASATSAQVTYTHGYDQVPADVVSVVCAMVLRQLLVPQLPGIRSEQAGGESVSYSDRFMTGTVTLTGDDRSVLNRYRPKAGTLQIPW